MKRARFIAAARLEFLAEVIYYNEAQPGLGERFTAAVEEAAARAVGFPLSGSPSRANTRRMIVKGFPFSLFYRPEPDEIVIFAVAHHARNPCSVDACNTFTGVVTHDYSGCIATLTVKAFIEGFYRQGRTMTPVLLNQGVAGATEAQVDSVTIELHSTSDFSVILDQYKAVLDTSGHVTGIMNTSSIGSSYYLAFRHRNSVLTCSAKPVFLNVVTSYDFSTHKDSAYGGNLIMDPFGEGMWVIYSGEVSIPVQDEFIGTDDVTLVDNDNIEGLSYFNSDYFMLHKDISGDGYLGTDDVSITNNNNLAGVSSLHP